MNNFKIVLLVTLTLLCRTISHADSVVISFADGKTQTIILDVSVKSITAVQYLSANDQAPAVPQANSETPSKPQEAKQPQQPQTSAKPKVKFKWAAPIAGQ